VTEGGREGIATGAKEEIRLRERCRKLGGLVFYRPATEGGGDSCDAAGGRGGGRAGGRAGEGSRRKVNQFRGLFKAEAGETRCGPPSYFV